MRLRTQLASIPLRNKDTDRSEMVSQLLYGEEFTVLEQKGTWIRVRCSHDGYEGWLAKEHEYTSDVLDTKLIRSPGFLTLSDDSIIRISPGSRLTTQEIQDFTALTEIGPDSPIATAHLFLNTPYLWGGRSIWGIDCSGLVQVCMACHGADLPRDAYQQAEQGESIEFGKHLSGDIVFFQKEEGRIHHVGFCLDEQRIIHASGRVRIDRLSPEGIVRLSDEQLSHRFHSIKRIST
ncbi:MAG: C40 family peptidase [Flavobacteriales bacterium]|nr:C40 family peptidase [Flavobacteriales bacterium]